MSIDLMNRVWYRDDLRTMEKFVALAIADIADDDGACYPSIERLARKCSCVTRTVQVALRDLEKKRLVRRFRRKDRTDFFQLVVENWPYVEKPVRSAKEVRFTASEYQSVTESRDLFEDFMRGESNSPHGPEDEKGGVNLNPQGVNLTTMTPEGDSPNTSEDSSEEPSESLVAGATNIITSLDRLIETEWEKLKTDFPNVGECRRVTESALRLAYERAQQHAKFGETSMDVWREVFEKIRRSRFLTGQVPPRQGNATRFRLTLSRLLKPHIFIEVINDAYSDIDDDKRDIDASGNRIGPAAAATRNTIDRLRSARERGGR